MSFSFWSSLSLLPATLLLALHRSWLALIYGASLLVTLAYHASAERRFRRLDHALAYAVVGANTWMALHAREASKAIAGVVLVLFALSWYRRARTKPQEYDAAHGLWHLLCGAAGLAFVSGYLGR